MAEMDNAGDGGEALEEIDELEEDAIKEIEEEEIEDDEAVEPQEDEINPDSAEEDADIKEDAIDEEKIVECTFDEHAENDKCEEAEENIETEENDQADMQEKGDTERHPDENLDIPIDKADLIAEIGEEDAIDSIGVTSWAAEGSDVTYAEDAAVEGAEGAKIGEASNPENTTYNVKQNETSNLADDQAHHTNSSQSNDPPTNKTQKSMRKSPPKKKNTKLKKELIQSNLYNTIMAKYIASQKKWNSYQGLPLGLLEYLIEESKREMGLIRKTENLIKSKKIHNLKNTKNARNLKNDVVVDKESVLRFFEREDLGEKRLIKIKELAEKYEKEYANDCVRDGKEMEREMNDLSLKRSALEMLYGNAGGAKNVENDVGTEILEVGSDPLAQPRTKQSVPLETQQSSKPVTQTTLPGQSGHSNCPPSNQAANPSSNQDSRQSTNDPFILSCPSHTIDPLLREKVMTLTQQGTNVSSEAGLKMAHELLKEYDLEESVIRHALKYNQYRQEPLDHLTLLTKIPKTLNDTSPNILKHHLKKEGQQFENVPILTLLNPNWWNDFLKRNAHYFLNHCRGVTEKKSVVSAHRAAMAHYFPRFGGGITGGVSIVGTENLSPQLQLAAILQQSEASQTSQHSRQLQPMQHLHNSKPLQPSRSQVILDGPQLSGGSGSPETIGRMMQMAPSASNLSQLQTMQRIQQMQNLQHAHQRVLNELNSNIKIPQTSQTKIYPTKLADTIDLTQNSKHKHNRINEIIAEVQSDMGLQHIPVSKVSIIKYYNSDRHLTLYNKNYKELELLAAVRYKYAKAKEDKEKYPEDQLPSGLTDQIIEDTRKELGMEHVFIDKKKLSNCTIKRCLDTNALSRVKLVDEVLRRFALEKEQGGGDKPLFGTGVGQMHVTCVGKPKEVIDLTGQNKKRKRTTLTKPKNNKSVKVVHDVHAAQEANDGSCAHPRAIANQDDKTQNQQSNNSQNTNDTSNECIKVIIAEVQKDMKLNHIEVAPQTITDRYKKGRHLEIMNSTDYAEEELLAAVRYKYAQVKENYPIENVPHGTLERLIQEAKRELGWERFENVYIRKNKISNCTMAHCLDRDSVNRIKLVDEILRRYARYVMGQYEVGAECATGAAVDEIENSKSPGNDQPQHNQNDQSQNQQSNSTHDDYSDRIKEIITEVQQKMGLQHITVSPQTITERYKKGRHLEIKNIDYSEDELLAAVRYKWAKAKEKYEGKQLPQGLTSEIIQETKKELGLEHIYIRKGKISNCTMAHCLDRDSVNRIKLVDEILRRYALLKEEELQKEEQQRTVAYSFGHFVPQQVFHTVPTMAHAVVPQKTTTIETVDLTGTNDAEDATSSHRSSTSKQGPFAEQTEQRSTSQKPFILKHGRIDEIIAKTQEDMGLQHIPIAAKTIMERYIKGHHLTLKDKDYSELELLAAVRYKWAKAKEQHPEKLLPHGTYNTIIEEAKKELGVEDVHIRKGKISNCTMAHCLDRDSANRVKLSDEILRRYALEKERGPVE